MHVPICAAFMVPCQSMALHAMCLLHVLVMHAVACACPFVVCQARMQTTHMYMSKHETELMHACSCIHACMLMHTHMHAHAYVQQCMRSPQHRVHLSLLLPLAPLYHLSPRLPSIPIPTPMQHRDTSTASFTAQIAPWGALVFASNTSFPSEATLDLWARGSGLASVSIFFEDSVGRRFSRCLLCCCPCAVVLVLRFAHPALRLPCPQPATSRPTEMQFTPLHSDTKPSLMLLNQPHQPCIKHALLPLPCNPPGMCACPVLTRSTAVL